MTPEIVRGAAIVDWVKSNHQPRSYRYQPNAGPIGALMLTSLGAAAALVLIRFTSLGDDLHEFWTVFLLSVAALAFLQAFHWSYFCARTYVVLGDKGLLFGKGSRATVVPVGLISRENVLLENMQQGLRNVIPLKLPGHSLNILVTSPFAVIERRMEFIHDFMEHIRSNDSGELSDSFEAQLSNATTLPGGSHVANVESDGVAHDD